MNTKFFSIITLTFVLCINVSAQSFKSYMHHADSLRRVNKLSDALESYKKAIDIGLEDLEKIDQQDWITTLWNAGDIAGQLWNKHPDMSELASRYWSMASATRGEKLNEKMIFLMEYGVKDFIIYKSFPTTNIYVIHGCSSKESKYLIWIKDNKTYVQLFNGCETYKPIQIKTSAIGNFYIKNKAKLIKEKLEVFFRVYDSGDYNLTFIDKAGMNTSTDYHAYDLISPDSNGHSPSSDVNKQRMGFKKNMETKLAKFIPMVNSAVSQYMDTLNSAEVRRNVGKL